MVFINRSLAVLAAILIVLLEVASSQRTGANCPRDCVSLRKCPKLANLLRNPTPANIRILQGATCSFTGNNPLVCCPVDETPKKSLLPRNCGQGGNSNRIFGGEDTPLGAYPWMAIFGYKEVGFDRVDYLCAGSIINERYILTAAHCVTPELFAVKKLSVITLGEWDLSTEMDCETTESNVRFCAPPPQNYTYEDIILHPTYNKRIIHSDDIALIRLSRPIDLSGHWLHPVCLPPQGLNVAKVMPTKEGIVAGWGTTEQGVGSTRLLHVVVPFVDSQQCNVTYRGRTIDEQLCMGGVEGQDSCGGDSGGPLVIRGPQGPPYLQVGIVSYGPANCGLDSVPGVYTDVSHYRDWIEENMKP